jgi:carboxymethylenebutenolidase
MGATVQLACDDGTIDGCLATPTVTPARGVLVVQEWWGLVPQIERACDRLAAAGFVALAPDLYHGEVAQHTEMDKAAALMTALPLDRAARDMRGAIDALLAHPDVRGDAVGVIGFCMGGMLTLVLAAQEGDRVAAAVPFYGAPLGDGEPDWSGLTAKVSGHFAGDDDFFPADAIIALEAKLQAMGKTVSFAIHPGTGHAFANEENPLGNLDEDAADAAWSAALAFLHAELP